MTTPETPMPPSPLDGLRAIRQSRTTTRRAPAKKTAPRKAPAATSRADGAAKKGKYVDRIVGAIKSGCAVLSVRAPVQAAIIMERAQPLAEAIEQVANEDKRVDAFIQKVSGFFGKSSAWGNLGGEVGITAAALALSVGAVPTGLPGMAIAFMGGELLDAGLRSAARREAEKDLKRLGLIPGVVNYDATLAEVAESYYRQFSDRVPRPGEQPPPPDVDGGDQGDAEPTQVIGEPEPAWAS
jgi:hypothetical protein